MDEGVVALAIVGHVQIWRDQGILQGAIVRVMLGELTSFALVGEESSTYEFVDPRVGLQVEVAAQYYRQVLGP